MADGSVEAGIRSSGTVAKPKVAKQSVPKRGSVGFAFPLVDLVVTETRRYRVSVLTVLPQH
jgi:hypothetical protein